MHHAGRIITGVITARPLLVSAVLLALSSQGLPRFAQAAPLHAAAQQAAATPSQAGLLSPAATENLLPPAILFKGQLAPVQARNSGAIRHADGSLTVVSLVDASGYSSGVRERFQFFLYTETPLLLAPGKTLPAGFYGGGFLADNTMVVLDVASHDLMILPTAVDPALARPRPLQLLAAPSSGETRLYLGRSYIALRPVNS